MSKHVFVRPALPEEAQQFIAWSKANHGNEFDPEVARYKSTLTFCAFDDSGPLAYMPFSRPVMLESFGPRPGLDSGLAAMTLKEFTQAAVTHAAVVGAGEVVFMATEPNAAEFAENQIFEELPWKLYRIKLKGLESKCSTKK